MESVKRILAAIFLRNKFVGQIAGALAGAAAALICAEIVPAVPDLVKYMVLAAVQLPEGTQLSQPVIAALLTPAFTIVINAVIAEYLLKRTAEVQVALKKADLYDGPVDRWLGAASREALAKLSDIDLHTDFR